MIYPDDERRELHPYFPWGASSLLDVGCSRGSFGRGLRSAGYLGRTLAVEPVSEAAAEARSHYDEVRCGFFPDVVKEDERFECISFNDVLEHLVDPWTAVDRAYDLLAPGGHLLISVPNVRYWPVIKGLVFEGTWIYTDTGVLDRTHLRWFTRKSILELLSAKGRLDHLTIHPINEMPARRLTLIRPFARQFVSDVCTRQYVGVATKS